MATYALCDKPAQVSGERSESRKKRRLRAPTSKDMSSLKQFKKIGQIGKGSFGVVHKVMHVASGGVYTLKTIPLDGLSEAEYDASLTEAEALSVLDNEYVVKYFSSFLEDGDLHIVMEYCPDGNLFELLKDARSRRRYLSERRVWSLFIQLALGLHHIHSLGILHRDMKSENVFLSSSASVRIGDLGVAKVLESPSQLARTFVGTPYYLSPELCEGLPYSAKSDVWSLGCLLYELCTLRPPFHGKSRGALMMKILRGKFPPISSKYSSELTALVDKLLVRSQHLRPSVLDILLDPVVVAKAHKYGIHHVVPDKATPAAKRIGVAPSGSSSGYDSGSGSSSAYSYSYSSSRPSTVRAMRMPSDSGSGSESDSSSESTFMDEWSTLVAKQGPFDPRAPRQAVFTTSDDGSLDPDLQRTVRRERAARSTVVHIDGKAKSKVKNKSKRKGKRKGKSKGKGNKLGKSRSNASFRARAARYKHRGKSKRVRGRGRKSSSAASYEYVYSEESGRGDGKEAAGGSESASERTLLVQQIVLHQQELVDKMDAERGAAVDDLSGDVELFDELFEFYKELAKDDDKVHRKAQRGKLSQARIEELDNKHAQMIEDFVLSRISEDQYPAIQHIYRILFLREEFKEGKKLLFQLLHTGETRSSSSSSS
ncbi:NEK protein kinase [Thecamonas trahens ATCC 50062]|uniref:non-specific serine/threonine protein kinase n=1 Tax=Thecamonas trahens ATCC 50062 TaxID=461836 RepID=A0A0L0DGA9_THETB|nr:NEK protein kinase [Thecamonas trahens ATCC 50062]KNC51156.1 NEK protein kinase [Thecamonas trahens ATCC 50062]|eukprot:XP_013756358.1 NEK protein kinase [Thecamonas trahens ATCC 50062]